MAMLTMRSVVSEGSLLSNYQQLDGAFTMSRAWHGRCRPLECKPPMTPFRLAVTPYPAHGIG